MKTLPTFQLFLCSQFLSCVSCFVANCFVDVIFIASPLFKGSFLVGSCLLIIFPDDLSVSPINVRIYLIIDEEWVDSILTFLSQHLVFRLWLCKRVLWIQLCLHIGPCVCPSIPQFVCWSVCEYVHPSIHLSVFPCACL